MAKNTIPVGERTLPKEGFIRLPQVLQVLPIGKTSWWEGIKKGYYPAPVKLGPRTTAWKVEDIRALIDRLSNQSS
ncbi:helix-turn-helix transcriptional regulator [Oceanidesulfovibrio marinus]|uniref:Transcriptional regulator n=1 Tax=Oceanidesulfovibrio marinus TaxID=370038 RepID=A0A6P1ZAA6_9BACT|nr:AlpA family phage regulatory protein [Oceanidesulfovibrio marinus]TVM30534.1 transcriptional regulator [Oceanidesulfovibrio marinus]